MLPTTQSLHLVAYQSCLFFSRSLFWKECNNEFRQNLGNCVCLALRHFLKVGCTIEDLCNSTSVCSNYWERHFRGCHNHKTNVVGWSDYREASQSCHNQNPFGLRLALVVIDLHVNGQWEELSWVLWLIWIRFDSPSAENHRLQYSWFAQIKVINQVHADRKGGRVGK